VESLTRDDILLIFDSNITNIQAILTDFNALHPNLIFTAELEHNNTINFLDTTTHKAQDNVRISIFRKLTFTDTIIPNTSNHPPQHKYAAVGFLYNRPNTYQLHEEEYIREENIIHNILHNNSFPIGTSKNTASRQKHTTPPPPKHKSRTGPPSHTQAKKPHTSPTYSNTLT
jgi:hypothetical protein